MLHCVTEQSLVDCVTEQWSVVDCVTEPVEFGRLYD